MYSLPDYGAMSFSYLKKMQGKKEYVVTEPSKLLEQNNGHGLDNIGTVCGNTIYFYYNERIFKPKTCAVSTYNITTGEIKNLNIAITKKQIDSSGLSTLSGKYTLIAVACHNSVNQDVAPTYSNYGTNGRLVCKDCGEVVVTGSRVSPLKIKNKPSVKYSTIKKGKVTLKFTNKYYKEKSNTNLPVIYCGKNLSAFQVSYKKLGDNAWKSKIYITGKKSINKTLNLKKGKYQIKVRYLTIIGYNSTYTKFIWNKGPWSKIKSIKVK